MCYLGISNLAEIEFFVFNRLQIKWDKPVLGKIVFGINVYNASVPEWMKHNGTCVAIVFMKERMHPTTAIVVLVFPFLLEIHHIICIYGIIDNNWIE